MVQTPLRTFLLAMEQGENYVNCFCVGLAEFNLNRDHRACIGQRFAKLELFTLMIKLVQTYEISYAGEEAVGGVTKFVTVPDKPVKIRFSRRL